MKNNDISYLGAFLRFILLGSIMSAVIWLILGTNTKNTLFIGFLIWGSLYFFVLFDRFWINPDANTQVILQNYFQKPSNGGYGDMVNDLEIPKGQRVVDTGWSPKRFFEYPVGNPIATKNEEVRKTIDIRDKDNVPFAVTIRYFLRPIKGNYLARYPLVPDEVAKDYFTGRFTQYMEGVLADKHGDKDVINKLEDAKSDFALGLEAIFGGSNTISDDEKRYARTVHDIAIVEIAKGKTAQAAAQVEVMAKQLAKATSALTKKGVDPSIAASISAALAETNADIRIFGISGAENLTHLGLGPDLDKSKGPKGGKSK